MRSPPGRRSPLREEGNGCVSLPPTPGPAGAGAGSERSAPCPPSPPPLPAPPAPASPGHRHPPTPSLLPAAVGLQRRHRAGAEGAARLAGGEPSAAGLLGCRWPGRLVAPPRSFFPIGRLGTPGPALPPPLRGHLSLWRK